MTSKTLHPFMGVGRLFSFLASKTPGSGLFLTRTWAVAYLGPKSGRYCDHGAGGSTFRPSAVMISPGTGRDLDH